LSNLQSLYIGYTSLEGTLPSSIGCLTKLGSLSLVYSSFTGMYVCMYVFLFFFLYLLTDLGIANSLKQS
jgi:hypothetical protein